ncbi:MAG TPA: oxidoreductase [Pseudonocardiaceae bacterium]|jgi:NAD(P)-dependent dehydrogenase (short-subunit alcohol dehydrogenase family)
MTSTAQHPIGSGFDADSTISDVLAGVDLTGTLAVVTGGYSGIGTAVTVGLAAAGASVIVPARRPDRARAEVGHVDGVEIEELDLADLTSVRGLADRLIAGGRGIDFLINNAAIMANELTRVGPHGWESQFAVDHLGHFALTNALWPLLVKDGGARVISVSSRGHLFSAIRWDDLHWARGYDKWQAYGQAKTANALFAVELDARGKDQGVRAFSVYPAGVRTPLQRHLSEQEMHELGWYDDHGQLSPLFKSPEQGAAGEAWAAVSPQLNGMGGLYIERCDIAELATPDGGSATPGFGGARGGVAPYAIDPEQARRLWTVSATSTGIDAFGAR